MRVKPLQEKADVMRRAKDSDRGVVLFWQAGMLAMSPQHKPNDNHDQYPGVGGWGGADSSLYAMSTLFDSTVMSDLVRRGDLICIARVAYINTCDNTESR